MLITSLALTITCVIQVRGGDGKSTSRIPHPTRQCNPSPLGKAIAVGKGFCSRGRRKLVFRFGCIKQDAKKHNTKSISSTAAFCSPNGSPLPPITVGEIEASNFIAWLEEIMD